MKCISKFFILWASLPAFLVATPAVAQTVHISHCMAGCPVVGGNFAVDNSELIVRQLFVASINIDSGLADWQAYRVLADSVGVASLLPRVWFEDSLVSRTARVADDIDSQPQIVQSVSNDAEERTYQTSEITFLSEDQGRLVPMTSFAGTPYWSELNFLSNMSPLPFELRVGSWSRLDQAINALADKIGEVYVVSGPLYSDGGEGAGDGDQVGESETKPSAYFKVVVTPESLSAFIFEADLRQHANFCDQLSTLEVVEDVTGLTLFPRRESTFADTLHAQLTCTF